MPSIADTTKKKIDAARQKFKRVLKIPFSRTYVLSPEQVEVLSGRNKPRPADKSNGQPPATPEPKPDKQPVKERTSKVADKPSIFSRFANLSLVEWILVAVVFGHALLIWYDCVSQWGMPGAIGGGVGYFDYYRCSAAGQ